MITQCAEKTCAFVERQRLYEAALSEAERHRWIESEKAGRDLGQAALADWSRKYWWRWCRDRWIEHLSGKRFWSELDKNDFGLLNNNFHPNQALMDFIVARIRTGGENLDIILAAERQSFSLVETLEILKLLDINSRRMTFWP